jgi:hypothetical protein
MYGDPVYVGNNKNEKKSQSKIEELEKKLNKITRTVDTWD